MIGSTTAVATGSVQPEKGSQEWIKAVGMVIAIVFVVSVFWMARPVPETFDTPGAPQKSVAQVEQEIESLHRYKMADGLRLHISYMLQKQLDRAKLREMRGGIGRE